MRLIRRVLFDLMLLGVHVREGLYELYLTLTGRD